MTRRSRRKVCFAASSGGHLEQLMVLEPLMEKYQGFIVTEEAGYEIDIGVRVYKLMQVNRRELSFIPRMTLNTLRSIKILTIERPDTVISTGALATIPICLMCKLFGGSLIYIESFAKVASGTMTGKLLHHVADRFYVQWENMLKIYPDAVFVGGVY